MNVIQGSVKENRINLVNNTLTLAEIAAFGDHSGLVLMNDILHNLLKRISVEHIQVFFQKGNT